MQENGDGPWPKPWRRGGVHAASQRVGISALVMFILALVLPQDGAAFTPVESNYRYRENACLHSYPDLEVKLGPDESNFFRKPFGWAGCVVGHGFWSQRAYLLCSKETGACTAVCVEWSYECTKTTQAQNQLRAMSTVLDAASIVVGFGGVVQPEVAIPAYILQVLLDKTPGWTNTLANDPPDLNYQEIFVYPVRTVDVDGACRQWAMRISTSWCS